MATQAPPGESALSFPCFGGRVSVLATGTTDLQPAIAAVRAQLEAWHARLTRFDETSELSGLNASPAPTVRVSEVMCLFVAAALAAAHETHGLVDPTLVDELETAGYDGDLGAPIPLAVSLALAPTPRKPARPHPEARWRAVRVNPGARTVTRPAGVRLDSGGVAKGLFADLAARQLARAPSYAVDCCGDLRIGGSARRGRVVRVDDPFGQGVLHELEVVAGGIATSGIGRRSWLDSSGAPAHHLLDPLTGRPAFTGIVQATALAATAGQAERRAKAALLSGPGGARRWLAEGGVIVFDDGSHEVIEPAAMTALRGRVGRG